MGTLSFLIQDSRNTKILQIQASQTTQCQPFSLP